MYKYIFIFFFIVLSVFGYNKKEITEDSIEKAKLEYDKSYKLLQVNNHLITNHIFTPNKSKKFLSLNTREQKYILDTLVDDELLIQYAFDEIEENNISFNERERLQQGFDIVKTLSAKVIEQNITTQKIKSFYTMNKKNFWHERHYHASHILLDDENKTIELIKILKNTDDINNTFKDLAKTYSKDKTSKIGGYLGHFESKIMVPPFEKALKRLKVGTFTTIPVKTRFGYHIILLHNIVPKGYYGFDMVKSKIALEMKKEAYFHWRLKILNKQKEKSTIHYMYNDDNLSLSMH